LNITTILIGLDHPQANVECREGQEKEKLPLVCYYFSFLNIANL
jgi:hypothetical protein